MTILQFTYCHLGEHWGSFQFEAITHSGWQAFSINFPLATLTNELNPEPDIQ